MNEVRHYMEEDLVTVDYELSVLEAAQLMKEKAVGALLVDQKGEYKGVATERDFLLKVLAENLNPEQIKVGQIMSDPIIMIDGSLHMSKAFVEMRKHNIRHIAVTENCKIVGMLSVKDFANFYFQSRK